MIKQVFHIERYWKVIVYYNVDYDHFDYIIKDVEMNSLPIERMIGIKQMLRNIYGVTISILSKKLSIVIFNKHRFKDEYISTIVHEAEHIKQAMFKYYDINDEGENAAYTIGYIVKQMYSVIKNIICG